MIVRLLRTALGRPGSTRRTFGGGLSCMPARVFITLLALMFGPTICRAQGTSDPGENTVPPVTIAPPRDRLRPMYEAATLAERGQYATAARLVQTVLASPEDYFLDRQASDGLKRRALALLASWPAEGRDAYSVQYSAAANALASSGKPAELQELLARYWMTPAGRVAADVAAREALDTGRPLLAALYWQDLRETEGGRLAPDARSFLEESLAWDRAGRIDFRRDLWEITGFPPAGPLIIGGVPLEGNTPRVAAEAWLAQHAAGREPRRLLKDWPLFRGDGSRNAFATGAAPLGRAAWSVDLLGDHVTPVLAAPHPHRTELIKKRLTDLEERMTLEDRWTLPATTPVVVNGTAIARTLTGLAGFDLKTGELRWRSIAEDSTFRRFWNALPASAEVNQDANQALGLDAYLRERLYRDHQSGALAADDTAVYTIETTLDPASFTQVRNGIIRAQNDVPPPTNRLVAYAIDGGELLWEIGGPRGEGALPLAGHYFLGTPLVWNRRLYCLAEAGGELRLLQLQPVHAERRIEVEWSQALVAPDRMMTLAPLRRLSGLTPTLADGLLICPTGCGIVAAVDPLRQQLVWGFQYESHETMQGVDPRFRGLVFGGRILRPGMPGFGQIQDEEQGRWFDACPTYAAGHVLLTPRDATELYCLDAVTGALRWKRPRGSASHVAGIWQDRVILVSRQEIEALRLTDGEAAWPQSVPITAPLGRGLMVDQTYLLAVHPGEILALDLADGQLRSRSKLETEVTGGNLVAAHGALIVQSARSLSAFRPITELQAEIASKLATDPRDPAALALRGETRLYQGDAANGLADLRASIQQRSEPRTAQLLANRLLDGLRENYAAHQSSLAELESLLTDPAQRAEFLRIDAEGLARAGKRLPAFERYIELANIANDERLDRVGPNWFARSDQVVRGRLRGLLQTANDVERQQLTAAIASLVGTDGEAERDARLWRYLDGLPGSDQLLQRQFARPESIETLRLSHRVIDAGAPASIALATAWLAKLHTEKATPYDAEPWLASLETRWADHHFGPETTGARLAAELRAQLASKPKRPQTWDAGTFEVERKPRPLTGFMRTIPIDVIGPRDPAFRDWTFELPDQQGSTLIGRDGRGKIRWRVSLPAEAQRTAFRPGVQAVAVPMFMSGPTWALGLGSSFVVLEVASSESPPIFRWRQELTLGIDPQLPFIAGQRMEWVARGRRRLLPISLNDQSPVGQLIGVTPQQVCYYLAGRLICADAATGRILWSRQEGKRWVEASLGLNVVSLIDLDKQEVTLYRLDDGEELAQRSVGPAEECLWHRGERWLSLSATHLVMHDLLAGTELWQINGLTDEVRFAVRENDELYALTPDSDLSLYDLSTGQFQWKTRLPVIKKLSAVFVDRYGDDRIVSYGDSNLMADPTRIIPLDTNHSALTGTVASLNRNTGRLNWSQELGSTACDLTSRPNLPIVAYVARLQEFILQPNGARQYQLRLQARFLDKRTGSTIYATLETSNSSGYQLELDPEEPKLRANFQGWTLDFTQSPTQP